MNHRPDERSILYQEWTTSGTLAEADRNMLRRFCHPGIAPGMTEAEALPIMQSVY